MRCSAFGALVVFLAPALADDKEVKTVTPAEAAKLVSQKVTVEMEVKSTGKNQGVFFLNSEEDFRSEKNFTAFINNCTFRENLRATGQNSVAAPAH